MKNRELVQLASTFDAKKSYVCGMMVSEKLDGCRALWLPWTMGVHVGDIFWANRERDFRDHVCSGLWSRYGKVIHAPLWFVGELPKIQLDGELWIGRGKFQQLMSAVKKLEPVDSEWKDVKYKVLDCPSILAFHQEGRIYGANYKFTFNGQVPPIDGASLHASATAIPGNFERVYHSLRTRFPGLDVHKQEMLTHTRDLAEARLDALMKEVVSGGGEGLILRNPSSVWEPKRTTAMVKVKPYFDSEAVVYGWTTGEGKYTNMIGALIVQWKGIQFKLSGMIDEDRRIGAFQVGDRITFRYREVSVDGIPKEARYLRRHETL